MGSTLPPGLQPGLNQKILLRNSRIQVPKQILIQQVMASPPSCTLTKSHTIASPLAWPSVNISGGGGTPALAGTGFTYTRGWGPVIYGTSYPDYLYMNFTNVEQVASLNSVTGQASFLHYGSAIEIAFKGASTDCFYVKINDQYITLTPTPLVADGGVYYYYIPFGSSALRRIDVLFSGSIPFGGVFTAATDTIIPADIRGPRCIVVGDSFAGGTGATSQVSSWTQVFADAMGWDDVVSDGVGGTGYLAGSNPPKDYRGRVSDWNPPYTPDCVIVQGSVNDTSSSGASIGAEAALLYQLLKTKFPNALLCATSPTASSGVEELPATVWSQRLAIKSAIQAIGGVFIDLLEQPLPNGFSPISTTLAQAQSAGDTTCKINSFAGDHTTWAFADLTRCLCKTNGGGASPTTMTLMSGLKLAESNGASIVQVGNSMWEGSGHVGATTGIGNCDVIVGSDGVHPSQAGHQLIGQTVAARLVDAMYPN